MTEPYTIPHGTQNGYTNYRCRCEACRLANTTAYTAAQYRRHEHMLAGIADPQHGTPSTYFNYRCRCEACRQAVAAAARQRRRT
jgi:hypothetical protein